VTTEPGTPDEYQQLLDRVLVEDWQRRWPERVEAGQPASLPELLLYLEVRGAWWVRASVERTGGPVREEPVVLRTPGTASELLTPAVSGLIERYRDELLALADVAEARGGRPSGPGSGPRLRVRTKAEEEPER
jgi:hypothetical protein